MDISVIGLSHHTAPVEVREKLALSAAEVGNLLRAVHADGVVEEALVLSTCNRTEFYFVGGGDRDVGRYFLDHVSRQKGTGSFSAPFAENVPVPFSGKQGTVPFSNGEEGTVPKQESVPVPFFFRHDGAEAVRHLFRVAAALDSQIVGENQVLGQVKAAYHLAVEARTSRFLLNKLLHWSFRVGKRVRTETALSRGSVSVAAAAVDLARQVFTSLAGKTVLLVGAGQMAEAAACRTIDLGVGRVIVANRSRARAEQLAADLAAGRRPSAPQDADDGAEEATAERITCPAVLALQQEKGTGSFSAPFAENVPVPFSADRGTVPFSNNEKGTVPSRPPATQIVELADIPEAIAQADLVICSTGSPETVLKADQLAGPIRRRSGLLLIVDIAVPRDVDPELGKLDNVFLYNLDDLGRVVAENIERRRREIPPAEAIVADELERLVRWHDGLEVAGTIKELTRHFELRRQAEVKRYARRFSADSRQELDPFAEGLCGKLLHEPIMFLRGLSEQASVSDRLQAVDTIRRMFGLDGLEDEE